MSADACPCGHSMGDYWACLNGLIYGPCGEDVCGGVCDDTWGLCDSPDCRCADD